MTVLFKKERGQVGMKRNGTLKRTGWLVLLLSALLVAAACTGGNNGQEPAANTQQTPGKSEQPAASNGDGGAGGLNLSIMWWGPDARHEATLKALDVYTAQHPDVTFTPEYLSWDAFWQKLPTLAASKTVTDVLQMDAAYIQEYVDKGVLEDLSDIDLTGVVDDAVIENLKIGGKLYGIPLSQNAQGVAFNRAELEAHGVTLPKKDWTWDDYFAFALEAREKLPAGKYGINDDAAFWDWYNWYQTGNGADPLFADGGRKFTLDRELFFAFHNQFAALREAGAVPPPDQVLAFVENDPTADPMASGVVMTRGATTGSVAALEEMMPGQVDVVNIPVGPKGGGWAQSTIFLSVSANSAHKEEAKAFIRWFITDKEAGRALGLTRGVPISPEVYAELEPNLQPKDKLGKKIYDIAVDKALPFYAIAPGFTEWVDTYRATIEGIMFGEVTIEEAYDKLLALGQEIAASNS